MRVKLFQKLLFATFDSNHQEENKSAVIYKLLTDIAEHYKEFEKTVNRRVEESEAQFSSLQEQMSSFKRHFSNKIYGQLPSI